MKLPVKLALASAILLCVAACGPRGDKPAGASGGPVSLFQWEDYMNTPVPRRLREDLWREARRHDLRRRDEAFAKMRAGYHRT